jgi:hypothetical protein
MDTSSPTQSTGLQVVATAATPANKRALEARDIAPKVRQDIADEFRVVKSSRILARKYKMPQHVISDILHLHLRIEPQSARLSVVNVFERRRA